MPLAAGEVQPEVRVLIQDPEIVRSVLLKIGHKVQKNVLLHGTVHPGGVLSLGVGDEVAVVAASPEELQGVAEVLLAHQMEVQLYAGGFLRHLEGGNSGNDVLRDAEHAQEHVELPEDRQGQGFLCDGVADGGVFRLLRSLLRRDILSRCLLGISRGFCRSSLRSSGLR